MQVTSHFYAQLTIAIIKGVASCLRLFHVLGLIILCSSLSLPLHAIEQSSNTQIKQVHLHDNQGKSINIGQLHVQADGQFTFERRDEVFSDHFLSMKEMKCIEGPELWCLLLTLIHLTVILMQTKRGYLMTCCLCIKNQTNLAQ